MAGKGVEQSDPQAEKLFGMYRWNSHNISSYCMNSTPLIIIFSTYNLYMQINSLLLAITTIHYSTL